MEKDAYYFPHFSNARNDRQIKRIRKQLGVEGYGIFFMVLEVLREQKDFKYPVADVDLLADDFNTSEEKINVVIRTPGLFELDESNFFSSKLILFLQPYLQRKEQGRKAALARWSNADALPEHCDTNTSKVKESKVKESKVKESKVKEYINNDFETFWEAYPKKVGKPKAMISFKTVYKKIGVANDIMGLLLNSINLQKKSKQWQDPQYIPNPATWLNQERWNDEVVVKETLAEKSARLTSELAKEDGNGDIFG